MHCGRNASCVKVVRLKPGPHEIPQSKAKAPKVVQLEVTVVVGGVARAKYMPIDLGRNPLRIVARKTKKKFACLDPRTTTLMFLAPICLWS